MKDETTITCYGKMDLDSYTKTLRDARALVVTAYNNLSKINMSTPTAVGAMQNFGSQLVEYIGSDNFSISGFYVSTSSLGASTVLDFPKLKTIKSNCFNM